LHMLRGIIGDDNFFDGLYNYANEFGYTNATTSDFRDIMEQVSGTDLDWFFEEWIYDRGYPEYQYTWVGNPVGDSFAVQLTILQIQENAPLFRMPMKVRFDAQSDYDFIIENNLELQSYDFILPEYPSDVILDPENWILKHTMPTDIVEEPGENLLPDRAAILNPYPNPFNGVVNIPFVQPEESDLKLVIYDIQGRIIRNLHSAKFAKGEYQIAWDGRDDYGLEVHSGIYFVSLLNNGRTSTKKITYIK